eukprot:6213202-Pleurochrysis_carterae.AAC.4
MLACAHRIGGKEGRDAIMLRPACRKKVRISNEDGADQYLCVLSPAASTRTSDTRSADTKERISAIPIHR